MNSSGAISFRDVSVTAAGKYLLKEISLEIPRGARLVVIGKNGAGKTTLFNLFSATSRPSGGEAFLLGEQLGHCDMRKLRQRIGIGGTATVERLNQAMTATVVVLPLPAGDLTLAFTAIVAATSFSAGRRAMRMA